MSESLWVYTACRIALNPIVADCRRSDVWPGYENPAEWNLPEWRTTEPVLSLNVNGQTISI